MADQFLGEIRLVAFTFPPHGWATCSGQLLSIAQNTALFSLLGTTYGGNGVTNFALPDFRGRIALHPSSDFVLGEEGGEENHSLITSEIPLHTHAVNVSINPGTQTNPTQGTFAAMSPSPFSSENGYSNTFNAAAAPQAVAAAGSSQGHNNLQPYTTLLYIIALVGIFPQRN